MAFSMSSELLRDLEHLCDLYFVLFLGDESLDFGERSLLLVLVGEWCLEAGICPPFWVLSSFPVFGKVR